MEFRKYVKLRIMLTVIFYQEDDGSVPIMVNWKSQLKTNGGLEILRRRYYEGHSLAMLRFIAASLGHKVRIEFDPDLQPTTDVHPIS